MKPLFGLLLLSVLSTFPVYAQHPQRDMLTLGVGDDVHPFLRAWMGVDRVGARMYVSTNSGLEHNAFFYNRAPSAFPVPVNGMTAAAYTANTVPAVGATLYGEADFGSLTGVWGANIVGTTYAGHAAHGLETNGVNRSGAPPLYGVFGLYVVNAGNAKTTAGVVIATSRAEPAGKPDYGIVLAGSNLYGGSPSPAAVTGIYIDQVDSGEAIRIQANQRIALNNAGTTYIRYDAATDMVQIVKNNVVVAQW